jgi:hypothetical protein
VNCGKIRVLAAGCRRARRYTARQRAMPFRRPSADRVRHDDRLPPSSIASRLSAIGQARKQGGDATSEPVLCSSAPFNNERRSCLGRCQCRCDVSRAPCVRDYASRAAKVLRTRTPSVTSTTTTRECGVPDPLSPIPTIEWRERGGRLRGQAKRQGNRRPAAERSEGRRAGGHEVCVFRAKRGVAG